MIWLELFRKLASVVFKADFPTPLVSLQLWLKECSGYNYSHKIT